MIAAASTLGFAPTPLRTVTELTSLLVRPGTPSEAGAIVVMYVGADGLVRSTTWTPAFDEANARLDNGSKAGISAPASAMLLFRVEVCTFVGGNTSGMVSSLMMVPEALAVPIAVTPV